MLSPQEKANVKAGIAFLNHRMTLEELAKVAGLTVDTIKYASSKRGRVSAGVALRIARVAGAPLEDLLAGRWPEPGMCPLCLHVTKGGAS
jgi:transcriptional regulator with XRE-family HTH domain